MKVLPRLVAIASLLSCTSSNEGEGALVLAINTGDLVLPDDAGTVGLYLTQIDTDGRMRSVLSREEKVFIDDQGNASVQFPGSLVVESHGERARLLTRLVAFRKETREVLTMREARAAVPTDRQALLRLSLFFTNQGNVVDERNGEPVIQSDARGVELRQVEPERVDPYARFRSQCDGGPAPEGMTAGDDGRCTALDVEPEPRASADALPGFEAEAICYDLAETFAPSGDDSVPTLESFELPPSGPCRVALPKRFDPQRLNVAVRGIEGFVTRAAGPDGSLVDVYPGERLRPLAAGSAFTLDAVQNAIELPERVCTLLRDRKLVFSQRTTAWRGGDPVCAPWSRVTKKGTFDGAPPAPLPAPDAGSPQGLSVEAPSADASFGQLAVHEGELALTFAEQSGTGRLVRFAAGTFEAGGSIGDPAPAAFGAALTAPTFLDVPNGAGGTTAELYVLAGNSYSLHHAMRRAVLTQVQKVTDGGQAGLDRTAVAMVGGVPSAFWLEGPASQQDGILGTFTDPTHVTETTRSVGFTDGSLGLGKPQTAVRDGRWIVGHGTVSDPGSWWSIGVPQGQVPTVQYSQNTERYNVAHWTRVADRLLGFGFAQTDAGNLLQAFDYESGDTFPYELVPASTVTTPEGFCFTAIYDPERAPDVQCSTVAELRARAPGHDVLVGGVGTPYVAGDGQYLYVAYTCGGPTGPVHVDRMPLADAQTKTLVSRCQ